MTPGATGSACQWPAVLARWILRPDRGEVVQAGEAARITANVSTEVIDVQVERRTARIGEGFLAPPRELHRFAQSPRWPIPLLGLHVREVNHRLDRNLPFLQQAAKRVKADDAGLCDAGDSRGERFRVDVDDDGGSGLQLRRVDRDGAAGVPRAARGAAGTAGWLVEALRRRLWCALEQLLLGSLLEHRQRSRGHREIPERPRPQLTASFAVAQGVLVGVELGDDVGARRRRSGPRVSCAPARA